MRDLLYQYFSGIFAKFLKDKNSVDSSDFKFDQYKKLFDEIQKDFEKQEKKKNHDEMENENNLSRHFSSFSYFIEIS
jgi:hypothetical protein